MLFCTARKMYTSNRTLFVNMSGYRIRGSIIISRQCPRNYYINTNYYVLKSRLNQIGKFYKYIHTKHKSGIRKPHSIYCSASLSHMEPRV